MPRHLVLLFDGTWNRIRTHTNVERFWRLVARADAHGHDQTCKYVKGVGVAPGLKRWLGGAFGMGLSDNVQEGYRWLSEQWGEGDEIWLFGFSRGAYTARSLGGLIRKCGLWPPGADGKVSQADVDTAYAYYRDKQIKPGPATDQWCVEHGTRQVDIRFIGVWDTVGELGVPGVGGWFPFARSNYGFHDTDLSKVVQYAYQALALDEHRADFQPTKWERDPDDLGPGETIKSKKPEQLDVEQRWFVGAHADVGGGEEADGAGAAPDTLPEIALAWLQAKAAAAGLAFKDVFVPAADAERGMPNDSYGQFMNGVYRLFKKPDVRVIGGGVRETIDASIWKKWGETYCPPSLQTALDAGLVRHGLEEVA
ncbi:MAG: DUF2235 domain-containing protein [Rhodanobacteraceae bacterium]